MLKVTVFLFHVTWHVSDQCLRIDDPPWPLHCMWMLKCVWHRKHYLSPRLHVIVMMKQLSWEHEREREMMLFANRGVRPVVLDKFYLPVCSDDEKHYFSHLWVSWSVWLYVEQHVQLDGVKLFRDRCLRWMIGLQRIFQDVCGSVSSGGSRV